MKTPGSECSVCSRQFQVRFRYQVREEEGRFVYVCSQLCQQELLAGAQRCVCTVCAQPFSLDYPYQVAVTDSGRAYYCSPGCREAAPAVAVTLPRPAGPQRIAVFNHKGGTGKTTTSVNLAAGLAEQGSRVLLIDADGQGNVGASLGIRGEKNLYHVLVHGMDAASAAIPVRNNLDVLTSNETLAAAELYLAGQPNRDRIMRERLGDRVHGYDVIVIDCAPALSLMNQNVLVYADSVLVPVSCDYLSLVGVRQVLRTIKNVRELLSHEVELLGVLPTFYDVRNKISREAVEALTEHFKERCLPPVRVNTRLKEAPRSKQTIFESAPDSNGAADYRTLVSYIEKLRTSSPSPSVAPPVAVPASIPTTHQAGAAQ